MTNPPRGLLLAAVLTLHCILSCPPLAGRAQTTIGGVVNDYYKITSLNTGQSSLDMASTSGLSLYDYVMVVQMKGASINTANNSGFGALTAYNDAGNYEINVICGLEPTRVYLLNKLSAAYDPVNGYVQLVRIPAYSSVTVTAPLVAQPWDNSSGTGGVLALMVNGPLTLNADINASDAGFRGGAFKLLTGTCTNFFFYTDYFYNTNTISNGGNYKGEGIADPGVNYCGGRGASANGGGGGNDHNTGGAGGGNIGAGGNGGNNSSTVGCHGSYPGIGAYGLSGSSRIFMGGGGGTGHANNGGTLGGANGGGIVYVKALELIGNGYQISANGSKGGSESGDGASGGGGGGTVLLDIPLYTGAVTVSASGGNGGDEDNLNIAGRCYGSGGGGGGGAIYFSGALPGSATTSVAGGSAGISSNGNPSTCNGTTGSGPGGAGLVSASYSINVSNTPETFCNTLLSSKYLALGIHRDPGGNETLHWKLQGLGLVREFSLQRSFNGLDWKVMATIPSQLGQSDYHWTDIAAPAQKACYRVKAELASGRLEYSNVVCGSGAEDRPWFIAGNPARDFLYLAGLPPARLPLEIYDAQGRKLQSSILEAFGGPRKLDIRMLAAGTYYVRCLGMTRGFVKQ